jgi:hypothetical protein
MGIQNRLYKARYGELGYKVPNSNEVNKHIPKPNTRHLTELELNKLSTTIFNIFLSPPRKDRYFKTNHHKIVTDYLSNNPTKSKSFITHHILLRKLIYFYLFPNLYSNNFELYSINWIVGALFSMRQYTMRCMAYREEIPKLQNYYEPRTNMYYPLVKPMLPKTNIVLAHSIHKALDNSLDYYNKRVLKG